MIQKTLVTTLCAAALLAACAGPLGGPAASPPAPAEGGPAAPLALTGLGKIAFRINVGSGHRTRANIYLMSSEHLNPSSIGQLTQLTDSAWNDQASWSPDGTEMLYTQEPSYNGPSSRIVVVHADGSKRRVLTSYENKDSVPCFSPDGTKIVFRRDQSGTSEIWEMNADGSHQLRITTGISPVWSPDGKWIAFSNDQNLWAIHPDGSGLHAITKWTTNGAFEPAWSPDGTTISFSGTTGSGGDIWLVGADGKNARQLTFDGFDLESYWSPDGTKVVFDDWKGGFPGGIAHLGVVNRDGSGEADLTPHIPYSGIEPAWQPR